MKHRWREREHCFRDTPGRLHLLSPLSILNRNKLYPCRLLLTRWRGVFHRGGSRRQRLTLRAGYVRLYPALVVLMPIWWREWQSFQGGPRSCARWGYVSPPGRVDSVAASLQEQPASSCRYARPASRGVWRYVPAHVLSPREYRPGGHPAVYHLRNTQHLHRQPGSPVALVHGP